MHVGKVPGERMQGAATWRALGKSMQREALSITRRHCTQRLCAGNVPIKVPQRMCTRNAPRERAQGAARLAVCAGNAQGATTGCRAQEMYAEAVLQQCPQRSCAGNARKECVQATCTESGPLGVPMECMQRMCARSGPVLRAGSAGFPSRFAFQYGPRC